MEGTQPRHGLWLEGPAEALLLETVAWLVYASSSPADTISRMATGRWSVRPDSWVIKLNSSTSAFQSGHSPSSALIVVLIVVLTLIAFILTILLIVLI